jgi:hypothetical protein
MSVDLIGTFLLSDNRSAPTYRYRSLPMTILRQSGLRRCGICLALCGLGFTAAGAQQTASVPSLAELRAGFAAPPAAARLRCYWWWLNGNTDKATITNDLEQMKAKGFGGALLVDAGGASQNGNLAILDGPTFGSPQWVELFTHALREADRLGLEITFNITSGWNLGGPGVTPEQASKLLTFTRTDVTGGSEAPIHLAAPETQHGFYRQIAVLAYPLAHGPALAPQVGDAARGRHGADPLGLRSAADEGNFSMPDLSWLLNDGVHGDPAPFAGDPTFADTSLSGVIDISAHVAADGSVDWKPPAGAWEILRIGYTDSGAIVSTSSGAWQGLAIDYLSRDAFLKYWNETVEPLLTAAKPFHSLRYLATDSWELGGTNWTDDFRDQFKQRRGYDPVPWLPVVAGRIVGDRSQSTRFLNDLRRTVADLIATQHYDVFAEKAREHGMGVEAESGGPHGAPMDALETFRHAAVPQTEFWSRNPHRSTDADSFFTKEAASAVNIYGQHFVAQEGETDIGPQWSERLATDLKPAFDMAITEGMNRLVWHEFTSSPAESGLPGQEYFAGTHLNPKVTWWNAGGAFFTYLNRAQFLMQQGTPVDDVLYFYGDNVPNFVRLKADDPAHVLPGYDYDVTNEDALLHTIRIEGRELVGPGGVRWRLFALPKTRRVSMAVLELIERFVHGGGSVVGLPPLSPTGLTSADDQARFDAIAAKLWAGCATGESHLYGQGRVFCSADARTALQSLKVAPDFALVPPETTKPSSRSGVDYVHRRIGATDIYFVRNASPTAVDARAEFRVTGKTPEEWNGVTGKMEGGISPTRLASQTVMPLHLPPFGSVFVVFSNEAPRDSHPQRSAGRAVPLEVHGKWSLSFQPGRGGPDAPIEVSDLQSWTESADPAVRYFSGTATYTAMVDAPAGAMGLEFSSIREIARVRINGVDAGTVWAQPYRLEDIGKLLVRGPNKIEIEVTNLWPNRLIGDLQPGIRDRITATNITAYKRDSPLLPSGLIGPIAWIVADQK